MHTNRRYQNSDLGPVERAADLVSTLPLEDKVGLLFHCAIEVVPPTQPSSMFGTPAARTLITEHRMTHFNIWGAPQTARQFAEWTNTIQREALASPSGIPVTFSSDPRHSFTDNPASAMLAGPFSQWPETTGLAAIRSPEVVRRFADVVRQEYAAVGIRVALHPQIDVATEPRWSRIVGTFGEDAALTAELVTPYLEGLDGSGRGDTRVSAIAKHFPGAGPQMDGEDAHFERGREQVYPADMFDHHLEPFIAAIEAGVRQIMPYYAMPIGTSHEEVGFGFNKGIITDLLRDRLGFDGIVVTDWGLITDTHAMGLVLPARAWGVEALSREDRMLKAIEAGVDQFGGEYSTDVMLDLVRSGRVSEERITESALRVLIEKFDLGLFDDPFVDPDRAEEILRRADFLEDALAAQTDSLTLLTNTADDSGPLLPLREGTTVYLEGFSDAAATSSMTVVDRIEDADVAIVRLQAPWHDRGPGFESVFHEGSLEFTTEEMDRLTALCATTPTILDIYLERPAVLGGLELAAAAVIGNYGASDQALIDVLVGKSHPRGRLPFDLPRSMSAVEASREDAPFDTADPVFRFGHGLRYDDDGADL